MLKSRWSKVEITSAICENYDVRKKKSVEKIRTSVQNLLEQSQRRCYHQSRRKRRSTALPSSPPPPSSPLSGLSAEEERDDNEFDEEPKVFSNAKEELSDSTSII